MPGRIALRTFRVGAGEEAGPRMHHWDYELKLLAEQRRSELAAQAERLNQLHDARRGQRRKSFRSLRKPRPPAR